MLLLSGLIGALFAIQLSSFREMIAGDCYSDTDSSVFLTIAREMLHGHLPYRDFFDHKGLYIYFVDMLGLLTHLALLEWLFFALSAWVLYRTLLLTVRPRLALLLMFLWPFLLLRHSILGYGNQVETFVLPAIAYAVYYPVALIKRDGKIPPGMTLLLGVSFGWILMLKFNYISTFAASGAIMLWMLCMKKDWKGLCVSVLSGLAGAAIAVLPGILYLWKQDILSDFVDVYILFNLKYADSQMTFSRLLRLFRCWDRNDMPNGLTRLIILFPWLVTFILFAKKECCDKGDKAIAVFILATLLVNAPGTWLGRRIFPYYFFSLTTIALLAYALLLKYALRLANHLLSKTDGKISFARPATVGFCMIAIVLLFAFGSLTIRNGIKRTRYVPGVPVLKRDPVLCELLKKHDARMLVIINKCFLYRFYDARPDCRYLYQAAAEIDPAVWDTLLEEIRSKKTPLILFPCTGGGKTLERDEKKIPGFFFDYLFGNYDPIEIFQGTLFVYAPEKQMQ